MIIIKMDRGQIRQKSLTKSAVLIGTRIIKSTIKYWILQKPTGMAMEPFQAQLPLLTNQKLQQSLIFLISPIKIKIMIRRIKKEAHFQAKIFI